MNFLRTFVITVVVILIGAFVVCKFDLPVGPLSPLKDKMRGWCTPSAVAEKALEKAEGEATDAPLNAQAPAGVEGAVAQTEASAPEGSIDETAKVASALEQTEQSEKVA